MPASPIGLGIPDAIVQFAGGLTPTGLLGDVLGPTAPAAGLLTSGLGLVANSLTYDRAWLQANATPRVCTSTPPAGCFLIPLFISATAKLPSGGTYSGGVSWGLEYSGLAGLGQPINASLSLQLNVVGTSNRRISYAAVNAGAFYVVTTAALQQAGTGFPTYCGVPMALRGSGNVTGGDAADLVTFTVVSMVSRMPA